MKTIPLTRGKVAVVDDEDYEFLNQWKWRALTTIRKQTNPTFYAYRTTPRPNRKSVYMHREVLRRCGFPESKQVDHVDSDGLNNQRNNLRPASASQNRWGMRKRVGRTSKFKGVYWHKKMHAWMTRIYFSGRYIFLGTFTNETEAGKAYDRAANHYFGEFARHNDLVRL